MKKIILLIPTFIIIWIAAMLIPGFMGMATQSVQASVFQNTTGCYIPMHNLHLNCSAVSCANDVAVTCATYQSAQASGLLVSIVFYIVLIALAVGMIYGAFKHFGK